jgi:lipopolysaccharide/colanic/teichoic acid biosynthesis glycosyltransferase
MDRSGDGAARLLKRAVDLAGASAGLVLLAPVLATIAVALRVSQGAPILYRQRRPGLGGRPFTILKFRTMRFPHPGEPLYQTDAIRITRLGRFLRESSLDELPELWNVVRGEMSLVGPRPLLVEYLEHYTPEERRRHHIRPGITGWAQVNGRNALRFRDRLALDVWYVDHWSLWLDLRILARTVIQVLRRQDVQTAEGIEELGFPLEPDPAAAAGQASSGAPSEGAPPSQGCERGAGGSIAS